MSNEMNYFEIGSAKPEQTAAFYGPMFGWTFGEPALPARYSAIDTNRGGLWDTTNQDGQNWAIFYVEVPDAADAIHRAQDLGATVLVPLIDNGTILFGHLADPLGNRFGVWQRRNPTPTD